MDAAIQKLFDSIDIDTPKLAPLSRERKLGDELFNDPMSPYPDVRSPAVYKNLADVVNNKGYPAIYPQSYTPVAGYFKKFGITPYFDPGEDVDYAPGALTIAGMVDLTVMKQPWALRRDIDIGEVYEITVAYRKTLIPYVKRDAKVRGYLPKLDQLIALLEKAVNRIRHKNGQLPEGLSTDIVHLLSKMVR